MGEEAGELKSQRLSNSQPHPRPHKSSWAPGKKAWLCPHPERPAGLLLSPGGTLVEVWRPQDGP